MRLPNITLLPLQSEDREQFILDNQWAFKYGAQQEFGMRDVRCEEGEEVISRNTIEDSIDGVNAEAYRIVLDGQKVGGVVLRIDKEAAQGNWNCCLFFRKSTARVSARRHGRRWKRCIRKSRSGRPSRHISRSATSTFT